jgi:hypothetical protein
MPWKSAWNYTGYGSYIARLTDSSAPKPLDQMLEYEYGQFLLDYSSSIASGAHRSDGLFINCKEWRSPLLWCPSNGRRPNNNTGTLYTNYSMLALSADTWWPAATPYTDKLDWALMNRLGDVRTPRWQGAALGPAPAVLMMDATVKYISRSNATCTPADEEKSNHHTGGLMAGANYVLADGSGAWAPRTKVGCLNWWGTPRDYGQCAIVGYPAVPKDYKNYVSQSHAEMDW